MKNRWIKVCTVWPDKRVDLWIDANLSKNCGIPQRTIQFSLQYRTKIDRLRGTVIKPDRQRKRRDFFEGSNAIVKPLADFLIATFCRNDKFGAP
jgi:hypothetical protein